MQYLLQHPGTQKDAVNSANTDGRTALHIAALTNNVYLSQALLDAGANPNAMMQNKVSPRP